MNYFKSLIELEFEVNESLFSSLDDIELSQLYRFYLFIAKLIQGNFFNKYFSGVM